MTTWTSDDLKQIGIAEELEIAPSRRDGTLRKAVPIWVVCVGDELYVRSYKGRAGAWFRAAQASQQGRVAAGGVEKVVALVTETDHASFTPLVQPRPTVDHRVAALHLNR